ncbi:glycosyltransferase family 2 protein [Clostridium sp. OS1-26]|uniref:tetratricopeptide repeat-containing glycosyltransferase family 2 protein n=1 Tax=Clostridium sp. OS1-26 TaxID=3070681 RepID=UPI0027E193CE|nr:glycosyltransferase family 2 protein [Clostridium sp. OS1-26]WML35490.1 glycosyltransferase family 2 protein [Clostridium sp. OS1-26]
MNKNNIKEFIYSKNFGELMEALNHNELILMAEYLNELFNENDRLYLFIYDFIISIDIQNELKRHNNKNVLIYFTVIKAYLIYMCDKSYIQEKKDKLIQVFIEYTNYAFYILDKLNGINSELISSQEKISMLDVDKAIYYLNINEIRKSITLLEKASMKVEYLALPVRYYIQRIIHENNMYYYKLSVCMIAKNEEKHIERCLKSLQPLVESGLAEIILVDTGSTDDTINIAGKYTDKIYFHPWKDDFAEARNYSIAMAKGEYLFVIDADEELDKASAEELIKLFNSNEYKKYNSFLFKEKNFLDKDLKSFSVFNRTIIFKNKERFCYLGRIHEQPIIVFDNNSLNNTKNFNTYILHYGYIMDEKAEKIKHNRNLSLLKEELRKNPDRIYYIYQIIGTYKGHGDLEEALKFTEVLINKMKDSAFNKQYLTYYNEAASVYMAKGMLDKAIEICDLALKKQNDFIDFIFMKGKIFFIKEEYKKSLQYIEIYLNLLKEFYKHDIANDLAFIFNSLSCSEEAINMALVCCCANSEYKKIIKYINYIIENKNEMHASTIQLAMSAIQYAKSCVDVDTQIVRKMELVLKNAIEEYQIN